MTAKLGWRSSACMNMACFQEGWELMPKRDSRLKKLGELVREELGDQDFEPDFGLFYSIFRPRLDEITDAREQWKIRHIVAIVFFAVLCNENEWVAIEVFANDMEHELRKYLSLPGGIPSHDTIESIQPYRRKRA